MRVGIWERPNTYRFELNHGEPQTRRGGCVGRVRQLRRPRHVVLHADEIAERVGVEISSGKTLQSPPPKRADVSGARPRNAAFDTNVSSPRSAARMASRSRWWCSALSKISSEVSGPLWPALTRRECALNACWPSLFSFPFLVSFLSANTVFTEPKLDEEDAPPAADANTS